MSVAFALGTYSLVSCYWVCGSVAGLCTMLRTGRSWVRFPMRSLKFSIELDLSAAVWPLTEISTRNHFGGKEKTGNLTAICESIALKIWEPQCLTLLWASMACYRDSFALLNCYSSSFLHLLISRTVCPESERRHDNVLPEHIRGGLRKEAIGIVDHRAKSHTRNIINMR
jgi:hypothetical protein